MQAAAAVASTFYLDPAAVLAEVDPLRVKVRLAALALVQDWEREAQDKARAKH